MDLLVGQDPLCDVVLRIEKTCMVSSAGGFLSYLADDVLNAFVFESTSEGGVLEIRVKEKDK